MIIILSCLYSPDVGSPGMPASDDEDPRVSHHPDCGNEKVYTLETKIQFKWFGVEFSRNSQDKNREYFLVFIFFFLSNTFFLEFGNLSNICNISNSLYGIHNNDKTLSVLSSPVFLSIFLSLTFSIFPLEFCN